MYSVLIADDERIERDFLRQMLEGNADFCTVVGEAENGGQTVALAKELCPDIVLLDINMPVLSGLDAARQIKQHAPRTVIVLNSAYAEFQYAQRAIDYDVDAYLVKPAGKEEIIATLTNCMQKRQMRTHLAPVRLSLAAGAYPYSLEEALLACLEHRDAAALRQEAAAYVAFFESSRSSPEQYRLFILNTLFSVGKALKRSSIPQSLTALLGEQLYLDNISAAGTWFEVLAHLKEYFARLVLLLEGSGAAARSHVDEVAAYIDGHLAENLSLAGLAAMVYLSPSYLSRKFHQEKNMPMREYITRRRVEEAAKKLLGTGLPIKEVAETCGFTNQAYFQKICKEYTGCTPAQIRRGERKEAPDAD